MEMKEMAKAAGAIKMPPQMKTRIIRNCREAVTAGTTRPVSLKRPAAAFAAFLLCFTLAGITGLAAAGKMKGFFRDIRNWNGAVTGTAYEEASDEIRIEAESMDDALLAVITFREPDRAPYREITGLAVEEYRIIDDTGKTVYEGSPGGITRIEAGRVSITLPANPLPAGGYRLIITRLSGHKKADQPLMISGTWIIPFTR